MRTLAAGSKYPKVRGFTLLELLVVVALIAVATAGVSLSLRDSADSALERDAERLATLLETARAQARANGSPVVWRTQSLNDSQSFVFEGLPPPGLPKHWLTPSTLVATDTAVTLGPEPLIEPRAIALSSRTRPDRQLWVVTDGLRPFKVQNTPTQVQR
ncbi:prepilin-type N-terminal cleavage/methylation domain-containing protein [Limnohabitans sp. T6-20]|uniref:prepilin-type N-terminal cleavage/methylation domain-containing protein n=1 Tax=Limnohabitans sp. T6-20 TaxID=1100725 RepID=UPI000D3900D8|nr:prepilin-type N-terminal cleavage/methylation domain-containing protein [Limnohabitans sp. T6-20]PUE12159.1 type II secretion system protein GspH [Limnohabitans sp. T6-20]